MKKLFHLHITIILICSAGCISSLLSKKEASDYFTEGFTNRHCFQVLVNRVPAKNVSGLIDSRESAYYKAKEEIRQEAGKALIDFTLKNTCGIQTDKKKLKVDKNIDLTYIENQTKKYLRYGTISEEYYKKDKSVVLVYRITRRNLRDRIASIKCKINKK